MRTNKIFFIILIFFILLLIQACDKTTEVECQVVFVEGYDQINNTQDWQTASGIEIYRDQESAYMTDDQGFFYFYLFAEESLSETAQAFQVKEPYEILHRQTSYEGEKRGLIIFIQRNEQRYPPSEEINDNISQTIAIDETEQANYIKGYISDSQYNRKGEIDVFFGEENELAATTDERGEFVFYYHNPKGLSAKRVMDFFSIAITNSKYEYVFEEKDGNIKCIVIVEEESFDMTQIIYKPFIRCAFGYTPESHVGILLPAGYSLRGQILEEERFAAEGESFVGVSLYINQKFIKKSNINGFSLDFIVKGATISVERQDFEFGVRFNNGPVVMTDTFVYDRKYEILEVRGFTDDSYALF